MMGDIIVRRKNRSPGPSLKTEWMDKRALEVSIVAPNLVGISSTELNLEKKPVKNVVYLNPAQARMLYDFLTEALQWMETNQEVK